MLSVRQRCGHPGASGRATAPVLPLLRRFSLVIRTLPALCAAIPLLLAHILLCVGQLLEFRLNVSLDTMRRAAIVIGWVALLVIIGSTLSPIDARPHIWAFGADMERFLAYLAAGALLSFAYPRQRWLVLAGLVALAAGLEWLQTLEMTRHGLPHDALVKMAGALAGSALATSFEFMLRRFRDAI